MKIFFVAALCISVTVGYAKYYASNFDCKGIIDFKGGVRIRSSPSTFASIVGVYSNGAIINIQNKVQGSSVEGNTNWYKVSDGYVTAAYVRTSGSCGFPNPPDSTCRGRVDSEGGVTIQSSPDPTSRAAGTFSNGEIIVIQRKVPGSSADVNVNWFQVANGYISTTFVKIASSGGNAWCVP